MHVLKLDSDGLRFFFFLVLFLVLPEFNCATAPTPTKSKSKRERTIPTTGSESHDLNRPHVAKQPSKHVKGYSTFFCMLLFTATDGLNFFHSNVQNLEQIKDFLAMKLQQVLVDLF